MIKHIRIDNRLIHGQVAAAWKNNIGADAIIVCNDDVAKDPIQKMVLPMAAQGSKVLVFSINELIEYDKKNPNETKFVICKFASDCLQLLEKGIEVEEVNIGNQAPVLNTDYVIVNGFVAATKEDAVTYRKIAKYRNGKLPCQVVPTRPVEDFLELLEKAGL